VAGKTYGITTSPIAAASAQWHHPQEGVEERDEQATDLPPFNGTTSGERITRIASGVGIV